MFVKKFEGCAAKTVGVGFLAKAYFLLSQCCRFLAHGCQNLDIDLKFKIEGCIDIILMCVKFGDDPNCSLDFSFIGGEPLNFKSVRCNPIREKQIETATHLSQICYIQQENRAEGCGNLTTEKSSV